MSDDMITEMGANPTPEIQGQYDLFLKNVDQLISDGYPLAPGSVRQPTMSERCARETGSSFSMSTREKMSRMNGNFIA